MSTPTVPRPDLDAGELSAPALQAQLAEYLSPAAFPATADELQASLIRRKAPARLLWRLAPLSPLRRYSSLAAVMQDLDPS
ncbi:hypothetical protein [Nostocoides sp. HKS02]|uniref:DUF2795 domain-containing protein n=1 Tax=Nostocoides sp. HKS02 TaxID=1813880 RepID=UPI0012B4531B|nr:hypothetical protein [Tetrasphaera sp. HKS02]QGN57411.1 hypothetical protein GKE56_05475 [Tetrasphaera sp. HKS02]